MLIAIQRGTGDLLLPLACDGLKGLPKVLGTVWPLSTTQRCILHLSSRTGSLTGSQRPQESGHA